MNPVIIIGAVIAAVVLLFPKAKQTVAEPFVLPYRPATIQPPDVVAFQKLMELKQHLLDKGIPLAEVEKMISDIVPHLTKEAA